MNPIYSNSFAVPSAFVTNGTATGYSTSDVADYLHPHRQWRSSLAISTADYIGIDLGSAQTIYAVVVDNVNCASLTIQGGTSSAFTSPLPSETVTVSKDNTDGRYKLFYLVNGGSGTSKQFWRIVAGSSSTTDGSPSLKVGSLSLLTSITTMTNPIGFPFTSKSRQAMAGTVMGAGGMEIAGIGRRYTELMLNQRVFAKSTAAVADFFTFAGSIGEHQPMVLYMNASDTSQVYVCRRIGEVPLVQQGPAHYSVSDLSFHEVC